MATVLSWNVNGIRSVLKKGFLEWLQAAQPDILCLQETRALPQDLKDDLLEPFGYKSYWHPAKKRGYSGTATYCKIQPNNVDKLNLPEFDDEGRLQVLEFPGFTILNGYWPNSQDKRARLPYKLDFCQAITEFSNKLVKKGHNLILCGDFNIAHNEIDLTRPKDNENSAGYYIEEREAMTNFLNNGFVDSFRHHNNDKIQYSWWSYRSQARARNVGWRIDYHCVNKAFATQVKRAWILDEVMGSDHCPVGIEIKDA